MTPESKSKSGRRAPGKTTLTISIPQELKDAIEAAAANESRSVSNYLTLELAKHVAITKAQTKTRPAKKD